VDVELVERAVQMVAVTPLPAAAPGVAGVVDVQGDVLLVVDPRPALGLEPVAPRLGQHLLVVYARTRFALWVDRVDRVVSTEGNTSGGVDPAAHPGAAARLIHVEEGVVPVLPVETLDPGERLTSAGPGA
jgi:purine-binding chemotaxis protein CheW